MNVLDSFYSLYCTVIPDSGFRVFGLPLSAAETHVFGVKIYWALWNCCFYCDSGLFLLRRKRFVE